MFEIHVLSLKGNVKTKRLIDRCRRKVLEAPDSEAKRKTLATFDRTEKGIVAYEKEVRAFIQLAGKYIGQTKGISHGI